MSGDGSNGFGTSLRSHFKLLAVLGIVALTAGGGLAWFLVSRVLPAQGAPASAAPHPSPSTQEALISRNRALRIMETRRNMREKYRSSHNENLVEQAAPDDMVLLASRGELTLLASLFQHYVLSTASFFELGRVITNNYVVNRAQVEQLFLTQVKPTFETAERRREVLKRRINHDPALELYADIAYIAYHDSIAVSQLSKFVESGDVQDFTNAVDYANTTKLMLRKFWVYFKYDLKKYNVAFDPPSGIWRRYFIAWDIVE